MKFMFGIHILVCEKNDFTDHHVYKISAHTAPIILLTSIEGTSQLVTCDTDGVTKIWDI
jgi:hypothetical protein